MPDFWPHQLAALDEAARHMPGGECGCGGMGLFFRMRRGKTRTALEIARREGCCNVLVIAPKSVVDEQVWGREADAMWPGHPRVLTPKGSGEKKARDLQDRWPHVGIVVLNHEAVWREPMASVLMRTDWDMVIVDESHRVKDPKGKCSTYLGRLAARAPRRLALTGTPMAKNALDVWGQYRFINPRVFGDSFVKFRMRYSRPALKAESRDADTFMLAGRGGVLTRWKIIDTDDIARKMYEHAVYVGDEVLDVPPVNTPRFVELEPRAMRAYRDVEHTFVSELSSGVVTAANAGIRLLRLQQLTGGTVVTKDIETGETTTEVVSTAKEDMLAETMADIGDEPYVVFARFRTDLDAVHRAAGRAGLTSVELSGRRHELPEWQAGEAQVIAVQIQAGGVGIDLTRARLASMYSVGFSLVDYEQARFRFLGPRQTRPVNYDLVQAQGTVDEYVLAALQARADVVSAVVERMGR